jgi:hypothetical protein
MIKFFKFIFKLIFTLIGIVVFVPVILWGGANYAKFWVYNDYYKIESNVCVNPGLDDGFVCQGICAAEDAGKILVCGYMDDKTNSRVYVVDIETNEYYHVKLTRKGGELYSGHAGGMATSGDTVYIANASKLFVFSLTSLLNAKDGDFVDIGSGVPVNNAASYVYCDEDYIYVGEFHHTKDDYDKAHTLDDGETVVNAIVSRYTHDAIRSHSGDEAAVPDRIYTVREKVQGICFTPDGKIVLSTSYGRFNSSNLYVYDGSDVKDSGKTLDGVPVFELGEHTNKILAPAMSEDLDWYNGRVITLTEVAANKYFYGKLFFADDVVALEIK